MGSSPVVSIGEPAERFPRHKDYGVLAQLGARHIRIVEATGSNPVYSSNLRNREFTGNADKARKCAVFLIPVI